MSESLFDDTVLVGGTGLSLQIGHRESTDIDLFGNIEFDIEHKEILNRIGTIIPIKQSKVINIFSIDSVKVDFVKYRYPLLEPPIIIDGIRLASIKDIAAMKLNAITGRGSRKDFIDLYFILKQFSFEEIFNFYNEKYDDGNLLLVYKSLIYFVDADSQKMPVMHIDIEWDEIKSVISEKLNKVILKN